MSGEGRTCRHCGEILDEHILSQKERDDMTSEAAERFTDEIHRLLPHLTPIHIGAVRQLYDQHLPNISASEALYAFCGWMSNMKNPVVFSREHQPCRVADFIEEFCRQNNLPEPREGWDKKLNPAFYKEVMKMDGNCVMHSLPLSLCTECQENVVKEMERGKEKTISALRTVLIVISAEDCGCRFDDIDDKSSPVVHQCPRCRALEVLEETKNG